MDINRAEGNNDTLIKDIFTKVNKSLTEEEKQKLNEQNKRLISDFKAKQLEINAQKNWDLFYKRNETRFFKDRHWTTREFQELLHNNNENEAKEKNEEIKESERKILLEVGCGVGNLVFPLLNAGVSNYYFYACDFSPRAVEFVKSNVLYDEKKIKAFQCDITTDDIHKQIEENSLNIVTLVFVLSAIHPDKFAKVVDNLFKILKPGGVVLFRDYGLYDMAQLRFKPGNKIAENFYMRQDGTRSYYFQEEEIGKLFGNQGFHVLKNQYIQRRTLNIKEGIDVPRIFLQGKFRKPSAK